MFLGISDLLKWSLYIWIRSSIPPLCANLSSSQWKQQICDICEIRHIAYNTLLCIYTHLVLFRMHLRSLPDHFMSFHDGIAIRSEKMRDVTSCKQAMTMAKQVIHVHYGRMRTLVRAAILRLRCLHACIFIKKNKHSIIFSRQNFNR